MCPETMLEPAPAGINDNDLFCFHATNKSAVLSTTAIVLKSDTGRSAVYCTHRHGVRQKNHTVPSPGLTMQIAGQFCIDVAHNHGATPSNSARQTCQCAKCPTEQADSKTSENA